MTTYNWEISQMNLIKDFGDLENVVFEIYWTRTAKFIDNENKSYVASIDGITTFDEPNKNIFIEFNSLTFEQVCSWLENKNNISYIDENLDEQIKYQSKLIINHLNLPWVINK
jgi:hypothetical protein